MFRQLTQKRSSRKQRALASAHSESLEPRILLTGQVEITVRSGPPLEGEGSVLDVRGTEDDDRLVAHMVDGQLTITSLSENVALPLLTNSQIQGTVLFQSDGTENIVAIEMSGVQGDDYLHNMTGMLSFLLGDSYWEWDGPETLECVIDCDPTVGGNDILIGGHGKDYLYGRGGDDYLDGRAGDDNLGGGQGNDVVNGGPGNDNVGGGLGDDILTGGPGHNVLWGGCKPEYVPAKFGSGGYDTLVEHIEANVLMASDTGPILESDLVNTLLRDANSNQYDHSLTVHTNMVVTQNNFFHIEEVNLWGTPGQDRMNASAYSGLLEMWGGKSEDTLFGGSGSDRLHGGEGNDSIIGGPNRDTIFGDGGNDTLWGDYDPANGGPSTAVSGSVSNDILWGGPGNDSLYGQLGNDELLGENGRDTLEGGSGHDKLHGGNHDDLMTGGDGDDRMIGGHGRDTIIERVGTHARLWDTVLKSQLPDGQTVDRLMSIEFANLTGTDGADVIDARPFSGPVQLVGLDGNDRLYGGAANDRLLGGPGDDWLTGGPGDDLLSGTDGWDTIEEDVAIHAVLTDKQLKNYAKPFVTTDELNSIEQALLTGSNVADTIDTRPFSGDAYLWGLGGNDRLISGVGRDMLDGGSGADRLSAGAGPDVLIGGSGDDHLSAGSGPDVLIGGKGNDRLTGGPDADEFIGGYGLDRLVEDVAQDARLSNSSLIQINGNKKTIDKLFSIEAADLTGNDLINALNASDFTGSGGVRIDGRGGDDRIHGSQASDKLLGGEGDDTLIGGNGNDVLQGGPGNDLLAGERGSDLLHGGSDNDRLLGGPDNDWLSGSSGSDMLYGGLGTDSLTGGTQTDRLLVRPGDSVTDLSENDARLHILDSPGFNTSLGSATAGAWTEQQVIQVDHALEILQSRLGGPALLKTPTGGELELHRIGTTDQALMEVATPGRLWFPHAVFSTPQVDIDQTVFRQIAYGWYDSVGADWRSIFGWTQTPPAGTKSRGNQPQLPSRGIPFLPPGAIIDTSGMQNVQSGDGQWYHPQDMAFADPEGHWNPREDFATAFAAYFLDYSDQAYPVSGWGAELIPAKSQYLHEWLESAF